MLVKKIKNNTAGTKTYIGQDIAAGAYYQIQANEEIAWVNDATLLADIGKGDAIVNDGAADLTDVAAGINWLKNNQIQRIQNVVSQDAVTDRPYGWPKVTATKNSTTTHYFKVAEAGLFLRGGMLHTKDQVIGDYIDVKIVDKDAVYYPAGTVLDDYMKGWPVDPSGCTLVKSESITSTAIPINVYFKVDYTSVGTTNDVTVIMGVFAYK